MSVTFRCHFENVKLRFPGRKKNSTEIILEIRRNSLKGEEKKIISFLHNKIPLLFVFLNTVKLPQQLRAILQGILSS